MVSSFSSGSRFLKREENHEKKNTKREEKRLTFLVFFSCVGSSILPSLGASLFVPEGGASCSCERKERKKEREKKKPAVGRAIESPSA